MKKIIPVIFLILAFITINIEVSADKPILPHSYTKVTENHSYIFVMILENSNSMASSLGKQYQTSGLYRNDGSNNPLWTIDWYALEVYPSSDGRHLVRMGPWPGLIEKRVIVMDPWPRLKNRCIPDIQQLAVAFYKDGRLLKKYSIADLVRNPKTLPQSVSHFKWRGGVAFSDNLNQLNIVTVNDEKYVFDVTTGEIVLGELSISYVKQRVVLVSIMILSVLGVVIVAKLRKNKARDNT